MIDAWITGLATILALHQLLRPVNSRYRWVLSIGLMPVLLGLLLYLLLLIWPGISHAFVLHGVAILAVCLAAWTLYRRSIDWVCPDTRVLLVVLLALPAFFLVTQDVTSFDPANYQLVGRTLFEQMSVHDYPFVLPDRHVDTFSWFAHPPILPLLYAYLHMSGLAGLIPYVTPLYLLLVYLLVFQGLRDRISLLAALAVVALLASTPLLVRTGIEGFATVPRVFFFTALALVLSEEKDASPYLVGILTGSAMLTHTIGLLAVPAVVAADLITRKRIDFRWMVRFGVVAAVIGGVPYLVVFLHLNSLASTRILESAFGSDLVNRVFDYQFVERGMSTATDRLLYGYLGPFLRLSAYGVTFLAGLFLVTFGLFRRRIPDSGVFRVAAGFLLIYGIFHLLPGHHNIFILSPRYALTILPIALIAGLAWFPAKPDGHSLLLPLFLLICVAVNVSIAWPYKTKPFFYGPMRTYVSQNLTAEDRVLVSQTPYFALYHPDVPCLDTMDPRAASIIRSEDLNVALSELRNAGFTYLLMAHAPTPFDSDTNIIRLFRVPGLLEPVKQTGAHYLFRFHYPDHSLAPEHAWTLLKWTPGDSGFPITGYDRTGEGNPARFWFTAKGLNLFSAHTGTKVAFARDIIWKNGAGIFQTEQAAEISIRFCFEDTIEPFEVHWDLAQFDASGNFIGMIHPRRQMIEDGAMDLMVQTAHPRMYDKRIPISPDCHSVALAFSYYTDYGGTRIVSFEISGHN